MLTEEVVYVSRVRVERVQGPPRLAWLPAEQEPVRFGVHAEIAAHYGLEPGAHERHAATFDYLVAAAAG
jgi:hypothetical protein